MVEAGTIQDAAALGDWIADVLVYGAGRSDAIFLAQAWRAVAAADARRLAEVAALAAAFAISAERRLETLAQGTAFLGAVMAVWPQPALKGLTQSSEIAYPVAVGACTAAHQLPLLASAQAFTQAFAANLVSAGVRLVPLGQTDGLRLQARLEPLIAEVVRAALAADLEDVGGRPSWSTSPRCGTRPSIRGSLDPEGGAMAKSPNGPLRIGIGGPVGSGKTALMEGLCKVFRDRYDICAITNDIYTKEDALILTRAGALPEDRILGVETGGCPHTAIREDASINLAAVAQMQRAFPELDLVLIELGGDNLAATFSPELADLTIYVIDVAQGEKIPRKGGPGITRSDLLVINKTDLAPYVGASLSVMESDTKRMRGERPFVFTNLKAGEGVATIARFVERAGGLG